MAIVYYGVIFGTYQKYLSALWFNGVRPEWHLVKLLGMAKSPNLFPRLCSGDSEQRKGFWPSFYCSRLEAPRPVSHALLCHHNPQLRQLFVVGGGAVSFIDFSAPSPLDNDFSLVAINFTAVPEPVTLALLGCVGLLAVGSRRGSA